MCKHFIINAIEDFNSKLTLENKKFRVDSDECKYFIRLDRNYFKKQGCISNDGKIRLNQIIKENTNDKKLKMIPIVIHKYFNYPVYEITVR